MFCKKCGNILPDNARFCNACGAPVEQPQDSGYQQTYTTYQTQRSYTTPAQPKPAVGFGEAVKLFFTHYVDFHGRARRSEYWWAVAFNILVSTLITLIVPDLTYLWSLVVLVPSISVCVRRLHDVGKSGWWYLFLALPLVGSIILLIQFCKDSTEPNQWGPNPKY